MKIIYTDHAKERSAQRGIKKSWIKEALSNPDKLKKAKAGRKIAIKAINNDK